MVPVSRGATGQQEAVVPPHLLPQWQCTHPNQLREKPWDRYQGPRISQPSSKSAHMLLEMARGFLILVSQVAGEPKQENLLDEVQRRPCLGRRPLARRGEGLAR